MNTRTVAVLWLTAGLVAGPAAAQTRTRADEAAARREQKATSMVVTEGDRLERWLDTVERYSTRVGADGFGIRFGDIEDGAAIAAGPVWRSSNMFSGRLRLRASAATSIARDREFEGAMTIHEVGTPTLALTGSGSLGYLAQERFYGPGMSSQPAHEAAFALDRRWARAEATLTPLRWLGVSTSVGLARYQVEDAEAPGVPAISTRFIAAALPGAAANGDFATAGVGATIDWRDLPQNPRRGGRYHVRLDRYADRSLNRYSFNRLNIDLEQHVSWWRGQRLLTFRGIAALSLPDDGHKVPFYLRPTLGGSRLLRGFKTDRFRDNNLLALQAEYAWDLWPFLSAVLFYEGGAVAAQWQDLSLADFRRDYGIGFRFGSARTVALRTDVAFGSGEGTRLAMRFSHAF
jgi:hypothetical protein